MENNTRISNRVLWLDVARAIAIILVVCGHCDNFTSFSIQKFAGLFFMPLFIFISGYLFKDRVIASFSDLKSFLKRRVLPIYKYYLTYELVFFIFTNLFFKIGFYSSSVKYGDKIIYPISSIPDFIVGVLKIVVMMGREPFCAAFWFFIALIFVTIGYSIIRFIASKLDNIVNKDITITVGVLVCFALGCIMRYSINIPRFSPSLTLILFYHLGNLTYVNRDRLSFNNVYFAVISLVGLLILYNFGSVSMNHNEFTDPIFLIVTSVLGIYLVFFISKIIEGKFTRICDALVYIGQNTLPIIAFHIFCFKIPMLLQFYFGVISYNQLAILNGVSNDNLWYLLYVICGVGLPLLINYAINKTKNLIFS